MGATVLLLVGVIGFPLLFETQPRPIPVDLPIEIPSRNAGGAYETGAVGAPRGVHGASGGPLAAATSPATASAATTESVTYDARPSAPAAQAARTTAATSPAPSDKTPAPAEKPAATAPAEKPQATAAARPAPAPSKPAANPHAAQAEAPSASSTAAAAAMLDAPNPGVDRYIVQVAAFKPSDDAKIRDVRGRVEKLGLKTYTQPVKTSGGEFIRVRVGPYPTKAEADSAVARIAGAGLGLQPKVYMP
jgi:DedD protein